MNSQNQHKTKWEIENFRSYVVLVCFEITKSNTNTLCNIIKRKSCSIIYFEIVEKSGSGPFPELYCTVKQNS